MSFCWGVESKFFTTDFQVLPQVWTVYTDFLSALGGGNRGWGLGGVGYWWLDDESVGLSINRSTMEPKLASHCVMFSGKSHLTLSMPLSTQECKWYWPIPSSNSLWHWANTGNVSFWIFLRWSIHIINPVDKTKWLYNSHWRNTTVSVKAYPLFHYLSPVLFTGYITELLTDGGKGHLLTSTFSKQLCNKWLEMWNDRLELEEL